MSTVDEFVAERTPTWTELEQLVQRAGSRPARLGAVGVRRLGTTYRATSADLAIARRQFPGHPLVGRLEGLVQRGRVAVYHTARRGGTVREFVTHGFWRRVRERPGILAIAALCLFGPSLLGGYWAWRDPGAGMGLVPGDFQYVSEPRSRGEDWGISVDEQAQFSSEIMTNNIRVSMLAFAGGILGGVGALLLLLYNGVTLGATFGIAIAAGNGPPLFQQVLAHGVLEMSCIVVAGAAGIRIGWAMIDPGTRPRREAIVAEARAGAEMFIGVALLLVLAGVVEGFITPSGQSLGFVSVVGFGLGIAFWAGVFILGRPRSATGAHAP
ncbi:MAG: stage II sporulation protein M [Acidimicrobiia bacterium]